MDHFKPAARSLPLRASEQIQERTKPLLRGWLHGAAAIAAIAITIGLLLQGSGDLARLVSLTIFGLSMIMLYMVSTVYHLGTWTRRQQALLRAFDHANIFVFIAGAYTPFCVIVLTGWLRVGMTILIWGLAALGVAFSVMSLRLPRWGTITLYIAMGWLSLILLPQIAQALSLTPVLLLLASGVLYTIGAVIYARRKPDLIPWLFGYHELFHLLVVCASALITATIWIWVVPFVQR